MSEEVRFETTGVLDEVFFKENAKYLLSPKFHQRRMILAALITVFLLAEAIWFSMPSLLVILAIYWITFYPMTLWAQRRAAKTLTKRQYETYPDGRCEIGTSCVEAGVRSENRTAGGAVVVSYEHLATLAMADHAYILMSKANQLVVFFTDELTEEERNALREHLMEKCPKLKIIR